VAVKTHLKPPDVDLLLSTEDGLFELECHIVPQIAASLCPRLLPPPIAAHAKHLAEDIAEDVTQVLRVSTETAKPTRASWSTGAIHTGMPIAVISSTLVRIAQNSIGLRADLELVLGFLVTRIAIWMKLHRHLAVCSLDLAIGGGA